MEIKLRNMKSQVQHTPTKRLVAKLDLKGDYTQRAKFADDTKATNEQTKMTGRNTFPIVREPFISKRGQNKPPSGIMEAPGNRRHARSSHLSKRTEDQSETICLQDLKKLRDDMKTAYEKFVTQKTGTVCQPQTVVDELKFYACQLIGHLRASGTKEQLQHVISDIVSELREEAESVWDPLLVEGANCRDTSLEVQQLKECLVEIKRQKQILEENVKQLINKSHAITEELNSGMMKSSPTNTRQEKMEKRKLSEKLQDLVNLQDEKAQMDLEQQKEMKHIKKDFIDIWRLISNETEANRQIKVESRNSEGNTNIKEMRDFIALHIKKLQLKREKFVNQVARLLKDIWKIITNEPFNFSIPADINNEEIVNGIHPLLHPAIESINCLFQCLKKNSERLRKKIVVEKEYHKLKENEEGLLCEIKKLNEEKDELLNRLQRKIIDEKENHQLKENEKGLLCEIKKLKEEKNELLNRLSKFAGANLTENNPAIADLSDPNRATKLAEQYSELYDNTWTDAFEVLETSDERRRVDFLLEILVESYEVCGKISQNQLEIFIKGIFSPSDGMTRVNVTEQKQKEDRKLLHSKVQLKALTELRKLSTETAVRDVKLHIEAEHTEWVTRKELEEYTTQCIKLCWFMHVQSPPVYLDAYVEPGSTFHTNKHRQYTKSGTKLDYLVWPTLLLHEGGPVLCKGVAQGK